MDYNATTPLDREVLATIHRSLKFAWGNPSSSHRAGKSQHIWMDITEIISYYSIMEHGYLSILCAKTSFSIFGTYDKCYCQSLCSSKVGE